MHPQANILVLNTIEKILEFTGQYQKSMLDRLGVGAQERAASALGDYLEYHNTMHINWAEVAQSYQGIILTPFFHELRNDLRCLWYMDWDCAGGCIWDAGAIRFITQSEE